MPLSASLLRKLKTATVLATLISLYQSSEMSPSVVPDRYRLSSGKRSLPKPLKAGSAQTSAMREAAVK